MTRNQNSHFALNPTNIDISRSKFNSPHSLKTSFNVGDIIPIYWTEILPGDSLSVDTSMVVRLQSLITPMMDNLYLDTYYFFVPNRLVWSHWQNFMGENTESAWLPSTEYSIPQVACVYEPAGEGETGGTFTTWQAGSLADYFGIPTGIPLSVSALWFRAYALICNDWFRSENLQNPLNIPVGDSTVYTSGDTDPITGIVKGECLFKACKYQDYFTSCLPYPQKGPDVRIPLGDVNGMANVYGDDSLPLQLRSFSALNGVAYQSSSPQWLGANAYDGSSSTWYMQLNPMSAYSTTSGTTGIKGSQSTSSSSSYNVVSKKAAVDSQIPTTLYADLASASTTINQLRLAFQIQKLYEKDARGGTRYIELLKSHFGVTSPDARLQRPEYLGGKRIPLNINQVVQNSETSTTPQGNVAAYSLTGDTHSDFTKSFVEHGMVIGLAVVRYDHTYQQGLERFWKRKTRFDYYWPVLANIGEQPVYNYQIYAQGLEYSDGRVRDNVYDNEVFGYNEAWAEYRFMPSVCTGSMRSNHSISLDSWHLADDYDSLPQLGDSWIQEDSSNVNRVIAVSDRLADQIFGDFYFKSTFTRPMPLYSIPGLIDHH